MIEVFVIVISVLVFIVIPIDHYLHKRTKKARWLDKLKRKKSLLERTKIYYEDIR